MVYILYCYYDLLLIFKYDIKLVVLMNVVVIN